MSSNSRVETKWNVHVADFANILKAFIGSNYLSVAFAFLESGVVLGVIGLLFVASLTDHCCHLIVKCKYRAIQKVLRVTKSKLPSQARPTQGEYQAVTQSDTSEEDSDNDGDILTPHRLGSDGEEEVIYEVDKQSLLLQQMARHMSYGDIGRIAFGRGGLFIVNLCIFVTQFGFCVGYFIFLGNTIWSVFPLQTCNTVTVNQTLNLTFVHCYAYEEDSMKILKSGAYIQKREVHVFPTNYTSLDTFSQSSYSWKYPSYEQKSLGNFSEGNSSKETNITHSLSNEQINISLTDQPVSILTSTPSRQSTGTARPTDQPLTTRDSQQLTSTVPSNEGIANATSYLISDAVVMTTDEMRNTSGQFYRSKAPDLKLLVLSPLVIFILFAYCRSLRHLGYISVVANLSILVGGVAVLIYILVGFRIADDIKLINWWGLPIFFGLLTGSYEGIGTVIPIESSMEGNRHRFSVFLHGAITFVSLILGSFGVLGYLRFGDEVQQMLNTNLPAGSALSLAVNICVMVGVVFTYPLQIFPVIELAELALFAPGRLFGPKPLTLSAKEATAEDTASLLQKDSQTVPPLTVAAHIPDSVAAWKRNIVRTLLVLCAAALAVIFRNSFAYIAAFTGALGSSLLMYVLPCLFHLRLGWTDLPIAIKVKDIAILALGIFGSIVSLYSVVDRLIHTTTV